MKVQALSKNLRISPRKIGLVAGLVRGRSVDDALVILQHTPKKAAPMLAKIISSASANARYKHSSASSDLTIEVLDVGYGVRMRRYFAAAHGRARKFQKLSSNVRVVLDVADKKATKSSEKSVVGSEKKNKETKS